MRSFFCAVGLGIAASSLAATAKAQDPLYYFSCSTQISRGAITTVYSSGIFRAPYPANAPRDYAQAFKAFLIAQGLDAPYANCSTTTTTDRAFKSLDYAEQHALKMKGRFRVVDWAPPSGRVIARGETIIDPQTRPVTTVKSSAAEASKPSSREAEEARTAAREAREAEFQAKLAAHEAGVAEYRRRVSEREAEIARQREELAANKEAAARRLTEHQRKMADANRRQREYEAAKRRHMQCLSWDKEACDAIVAGKPALEQKLADAGEASTDTDANRCVTTAEVRTNASFQGNTAASVLNGCGQPVDVRICLKRTEGWNCGTDWGVSPQGRAVHSSFNATGEVFVDARVSTSKRPLASPEGG